METLALNTKQKFEEKELKDYSFVIRQDEDAYDPREEEYNLVKIICFHPRYRLGDEHYWDSLEEALFKLALKYLKEKEEDEHYWDSLEEALSKLALKHLKEKEKEEDMKEWNISTLYKKLEESGKMVISPLSLYEHGSIVLRRGVEGEPVGFIYQTKKKTLAQGIEESRWKDAASKNIDNEIKRYNYYLAGEVYNITICFDPTGEDIATLSGYYGQESLEEAYDKIKEKVLAHSAWLPLHNLCVCLRV